jgi:hypothetical protein
MNDIILQENGKVTEDKFKPAANACISTGKLANMGFVHANDEGIL